MPIMEHRNTDLEISTAVLLHRQLLIPAEPSSRRQHTPRASPQCLTLHAARSVVCPATASPGPGAGRRFPPWDMEPKRRSLPALPLRPQKSRLLAHVHHHPVTSGRTHQLAAPAGPNRRPRRRQRMARQTSGTRQPQIPQEAEGADMVGPHGGAAGGRSCQIRMRGPESATRQGHPTKPTCVFGRGYAEDCNARGRKPDSSVPVQGGTLRKMF